MVYKVAPYIPDQEIWDSQTSLTDVDIQNLVDWGFNFVRLGVMWEAVETAPGVYNQTYIQEIDKLITRLGKAGIHTLVDAHQDLLSRSICGEGMPNFYARQILAEKTYCIDPKYDSFLVPFAKKLGLCMSMDDYDLRYDQDNNPLIEDCQKTNFAEYYKTVEAISLFRSIYTNKLGM